MPHTKQNGALWAEVKEDPVDKEKTLNRMVDLRKREPGHTSSLLGQCFMDK